MITELLSKRRGLCAGLMAVGLGALALPAGAQSWSTDTGGDVSGVTVYAPHHYARQPLTGATVQLDQVSMAVPIDDLDLTRPGDAREARRRIEAAAREVCDRARDAYPVDTEVNGGCEAVAMRHALAQAEDAAGYPIVAWGYR